MELVKLNEKYSFDPTPRLKSSPIPIFFVSFNCKDDNCIHCGEEYTHTYIKNQKYCKYCLSRYLTKITDIDIYLNVYFFPKDLKCNEHEISRTKVHRNIQECFRKCLKILFFKQIINFNSSSDYSLILNTKMYEESTLTKKFISIIYLPWWDDVSQCYYCKEELVFTSNCKKYCEDCFIVYFIGCRYCLTTNIIFGITNQSQSEGGFSIVYQATLLDDIEYNFWTKKEHKNIFILKRFKNSQYAKEYLLKELLHPQVDRLDSYILIMEYAPSGDLHKYLQKNFTEIIWKKKVAILYDIANGLLDLGLSQPANDTLLDNEIYGVIPYIAPEIFMGSVFSKKSDIYSSLIFNIIDGVRPEITEDTPECYANLMKSCWDPVPNKRPSINVIENSEKLGPKFSEKSHPEAIYTSRPLSSCISKCSSIFSNCSSNNFSSNDYISNELEFDIDNKSSKLVSYGTKRNIEELNINSCENNGKRIKN
ncbi:kinase-like domain-containing protein [Rhizophagus diaphanus]|nr:kinase-like domain-containing protein [Rhizophagus diaphanus] [Rhizophagus sp. MUCL 43196]